MLFIPVEDHTKAAEILNKDLRKIQDWSEKWLVQFNEKKTDSMIFSRKRKSHAYPNLYLNNSKIVTVTSHKHLGITLSDDGKWSEHINNISSRANPKLLIIRRLKYLLDRKSLENIYYSYIRPILEYGNVVWGNCTEENKIQLEKVQLEAARIVTGAVKGIPHEKLYRETGWETLEQRRNHCQLYLMHKMINKETPQCLQILLPPPCNTTYQTRYNPNLQPVFARSNQYYSSFIPKTIRMWNELDSTVKDIRSLNSFKAKLKKKDKTPKYYNTGNRKAQIIHAKLRMNCSDLNHDMLLRFLSDSASCSCGHMVENAEHYFLHCPNYANNRSIYLPRNTPIEILLYRDNDRNENENKDIFQRVSDFIENSKRF